MTTEKILIIFVCISVLLDFTASEELRFNDELEQIQTITTFKDAERDSRDWVRFKINETSRSPFKFPIAVPKAGFNFEIEIPNLSRTVIADLGEITIAFTNDTSKKVKYNFVNIKGAIDVTYNWKTETGSFGRTSETTLTIGVMENGTCRVMSVSSSFQSVDCYSFNETTPFDNDNVMTHVLLTWTNIITPIYLSFPPSVHFLGMMAEKNSEAYQELVALAGQPREGGFKTYWWLILIGFAGVVFINGAVAVIVGIKVASRKSE